MPKTFLIISLTAFIAFFTACKKPHENIGPTIIINTENRDVCFLNDTIKIGLICNAGSNELDSLWVQYDGKTDSIYTLDGTHFEETIEKIIDESGTMEYFFKLKDKEGLIATSKHTMVCRAKILPIFSLDTLYKDTVLINETVAFDLTIEQGDFPLDKLYIDGDILTDTINLEGKETYIYSYESSFNTEKQYTFDFTVTDTDKNSSEFTVTTNVVSDTSTKN